MGYIILVLNVVCFGYLVFGLYLILRCSFVYLEFVVWLVRRNGCVVVVVLNVVCCGLFVYLAFRVILIVLGRRNLEVYFDFGFEII